MCLENNNDGDKTGEIGIKVIQAGNVNLFRSDSPYIAKKDEVFILHPSKYFLLDAFVCEGNLSFAVSNKYDEVVG